MFFRKRVVPPKPASLVKLSLRTSSLISGAGNSTPSNDQVPEERYAQSSLSSAGTAATAAPVSCEQVATTWSSPRPVSARTSGDNGPKIVPGATSLGKIFPGKPHRSIKTLDQAWVRGL